jgi:dihydroflavonol-4-reductase
MARRRMFFDARKAVQELGMPQTPVERALEEAVQWFVERGMAPAPRNKRWGTRDGQQPDSACHR